MIDIDPPYTTGNDFVYHDDFAHTIEEEELAAGNVDEEGIRYRKNLDSNGRFHSDWCSMIYSRLLVARSLLTEDGVIFISIDQAELDNTKKICNEVFGAANYITDLVWSGGRKNDSKYISVSHEYVVCFFKNVDYIAENKIVWRERKQGLEDIYKEYDILRKKYKADDEAVEKELKQWYKDLPNNHPAKDHKHYNHVDSKGIYFPSDISWPGGGGPKYEVLHPITKKPVKIPSRGWITSESNLCEWIKQDKVDFGDNENSVPTVKSYLMDNEYAVPYSVFYQDGRAASKRLATLMGEKVFENPKDEEILQRFIEFVGVKDGDIVLDFFSGSASTAHAVMLANLDKKMQAKYIMVQIAEEISIKNSSSEKSKKVAQSAINLCDSLSKPHTIPEIAKERIHRSAKQIVSELDTQLSKAYKVLYDLCGGAIESTNSSALTYFIKNSTLEQRNKFDKAQQSYNILKEQKEKLDTGFRVFRLDNSNYENVENPPGEYDQKMLDLFADNIKTDRTDLDLLFGAMLSWGVQLSLPMQTEEVDGCKIYTVDGNGLVACFAENVTENVVKAMAAKNPLRVLFRDSCFGEDKTKINIFELFKQQLDWDENESMQNIRVI